MYGKFNGAAIVCYVIGILIQIPFVATSLYTGPVAALIKGVDASWIVGLTIVSVGYWAMARGKRSVQSQSAAAHASRLKST